MPRGRPRWPPPTSPPRIIQALAELVAAQEAATPAKLMAEMAGYVDAGTADYLMRDSGALPPCLPACRPRSDEA